ncbi:MAG: ABC transporter permease [bacterium]
MFKNFMKIAFRNLVKNRLYAIINIVGLSVALACCIVAYVNYQFADGFDAFHENADKIYRINSIKMVNNRAQKWGITPMPLGPAIQKDFAGVERAVRITEERIVLRHEDKVFNENVYLVDSGFLDMFTYPLKYGSPEALQQKNRLVISEALALKYFGDVNPVGKQVTVRSGNGRTHAFEIGAVAEKEPLNSSIRFSILANYENVLEFTDVDDLNSWRRWGMVTFIQVTDPAIIGGLENQLGPYLNIQNEARPDWPIVRFYFDPLREAAMHARDLFSDPLTDGMHPAAILGPSITAFLLLLMACFNFMNTSIAFSNKRLKEIGVRKVLGATVANVTTLLSKDFVKLVLLANVVAWPIAWYAMNRWLQNFAYRISIEWWVFVLAGGLALLIALLTVSTQAIRAALANPVESLRYE